MKSSILLAVGCAFALVAVPVMAQDNSQAAAPSQTDDQQAAPADSQSMDANDQQSSQKSFHRHHSMPAHRHMNSAAMALNGSEPGTAAYQASDRQKSYPAVDHGHVPGDPPVIKHDEDQASVPNPTAATITVPPGH